MGALVGNHWHCDEHHAQIINDRLDTLTGFVYQLTHLPTGRVYFGRKAFWTKRTSYRIAKSSGRRVRRHSYVESDWRRYRGSSDTVAADVDKDGWDSFRSEIIGVFEGKSGVATAEATIVLATGCLLKPERCYNRQSPALRGYIRLKDSDQEELQRILDNIYSRRIGCTTNH